MQLFIFPNNYSPSSFSSLLHCLACSAHMSFLLVFHSAFPESHAAGFAMLCFVLICAVSSYNMNSTHWILAILLHYRFKFFLPSIFSLLSLLCTACSFVAIIKVLLQSFFHKPLTICHHLFMSCSCCSSSFTSGFASLVALSNESSSVGIYSSFHVGI